MTGRYVPAEALEALIVGSHMCACGHDRYDDHDTADTHCTESHLHGCAGEIECGCDRFDPVVWGVHIRAALADARDPHPDVAALLARCEELDRLPFPSNRRLTTAEVRALLGVPDPADTKDATDG